MDEVELLCGHRYRPDFNHGARYVCCPECGQWYQVQALRTKVVYEVTTTTYAPGDDGN